MSIRKFSEENFVGSFFLFFFWRAWLGRPVDGGARLQGCHQGLYIIFQMDWKHARRPITKYTFPFLPSSLQVKNIASGKKLQRLLGNTNGGRPDNGVSVCEGLYSKP